jgi:hypothetical protein
MFTELEIRIRRIFTRCNPINLTDMSEEAAQECVNFINQFKPIKEVQRQDAEIDRLREAIYITIKHFECGTDTEAHVNYLRKTLTSKAWLYSTRKSEGLF